MFKLDAATMSLALLLTSCADVGDPASARSPDQNHQARACAYGRHAWTEALEIPDGDRRGVLIGPIVVEDDGADLGPVILRVDLRHPATGDLDLWLCYDADGDMNPEARAPVEFFRSRSDPGSGELHACPASLDGSYFFRDGAGGERAFAVFDRLRRGHAFYLAVADTLAGAAGVVLGWAVYLESPVPAARRGAGQLL
jgi:hypothetical protein